MNSKTPGLDIRVQVKKLEEQMQELEKRITAKLMKLIQKRFEEDESIQEQLSEDEIDVVKYGGIDNRIILIFDDCASLIDQSLQKNTLFQQLFM